MAFVGCAGLGSGTTLPGEQGLLCNNKAEVACMHACCVCTRPNTVRSLQKAGRCSSLDTRCTFTRLPCRSCSV